ncbi:MAG: AbiH family protein [Leptotrichia hongkongensis]|jgi:lmo0469 protein|nr:AbiH family protein [Leptotrichia hongkongensis]
MIKDFFKKTDTIINDRNENLLIIGNGFDLYMGFASSYDDYFKNHKNKYDNFPYKLIDKRNKIQTIIKEFSDLEYSESSNKEWHIKQILQKLNDEEIINQNLFLVYLLFCDDSTEGISWTAIEKRILSYVIEVSELINELENEQIDFNDLQKKVIMSLNELPKNKDNNSKNKITINNKDDITQIEKNIKEFYNSYKINISTQITSSKELKRYFFKELLKKYFIISNFLKTNKIFEKYQKFVDNENSKLEDENKEVYEELENFNFKSREELKKYFGENLTDEQIIEEYYKKTWEFYLKLKKISSEILDFPNNLESYYKINLLSELNKTEKDFGKYLEKQQKKGIDKIIGNLNYYISTKYHNDKIAPPLKIPKIKIDENDFKKTKENFEEEYQKIFKLFNDKNTYTVLNFNYTDYLSNKTIKELLNIKNVLNIHGNFQEPIFGIDNKSFDIIPIFSDTEYIYEDEIKNKEHIKNFVKAARVLHHGILKKFKLPAIDKLKSIYFFGHSLSEADYSYFQAIFDLYNIYSSEINLIFLYSDFKPTQRAEQNFAVMKLLEEYGKSMDNKDKGKNLYYKLLIENRIKLLSLEQFEELNINKTETDRGEN